MTADELIRRAAVGAPPAGRRIRGRCDPQARALRAPGPGRRAISASLSHGVRARARARRSCLRYAPVHCSKAGLAPSIDDVVELAEPVLKHRMALTFAARADGETIEAVIGKLKTRIG